MFICVNSHKKETNSAKNLQKHQKVFFPIPYWSTKRKNANPILIHLHTGLFGAFRKNRAMISFSGR